MSDAPDGFHHESVMVEEVVAFLDAGRGGWFFDGTVGGGGHAAAILRAGREARVIGVDRDPEALEAARRHLADFSDRVELRRDDFASAAEELDTILAGALLDLGVSSHQLDSPGRGFSFRRGVRLDMRMSGDAAGGPTAADLLNELPEDELADLLYRYGEEHRSRRMAAEIVARRDDRPFVTSDDLVAVIDRVLGARTKPRDRARIFQALRIAVNDELDALERALPALRDRLQPGGVFVALSYHSLEDRRVKHAFREWSKDCVCPPDLPICRCRGVALGELLTRKPVYASENEIERNTRARSARLRAWRSAA